MSKQNVQGINDLRCEKNKTGGNWLTKNTSKGVGLNTTRILKNTKNSLKFEWEISNDILHEFYWKYFGSNNKADCCCSLVVTHVTTHTKWKLSWNPYGDKNSNSDNESMLYLVFVNKLNTIKEVTINKTIICKQLPEKSQKFTIKAATYNKCQGFDWGNHRRFKIKDLKKYHQLTFQCEIEFIGFPIFNGKY